MCYCKNTTEPNSIIFDPVKAEQSRENISNELKILSVEAQKHYKRPTRLGGGGNSFKNWIIPDSLTETANGSYSYELREQNKINLIGMGKITGNDRINPVRLELTVLPSNVMEIEIVN